VQQQLMAAGLAMAAVDDLHFAEDASLDLLQSLIAAQ
jgi:predicted ATPase